MYTDVMLDLETLDTTVNAVILSIGAVAFSIDKVEDPKDMLIGTPDRRFEITINPDGQLGRTSSASTFFWWLQQSDNARERLVECEKHPLYYSLEQFKKWALMIGAERLWGNGAAFDNAILRSAYNQCGIRHPFTFRQDYCYRTIFGLKRHLWTNTLNTEGMTPHVALHDAIVQACTLQRIIKLGN